MEEQEYRVVGVDALMGRAQVVVPIGTRPVMYPDTFISTDNSSISTVCIIIFFNTKW